MQRGLFLLGICLLFSFSVCFATVDTVMVVDFNFQPPSVTISPGDSVLWIVAPSCCVHTVTRTATPTWDSGPLTTGGHFERAFPVCGTYNYFCTPHQIIGMTGTVNVVQAGAPAKGDMNGNGNLSSADAVALFNCVFLGIGNCDFCFTDVNCTADLTAADGVLELNAVFLGSPFPC